jgi:plasmid stabilization system protein ParE
MNKWTLSLHPGAEADLLDGFDWYAERNSDAADEFAVAVREAGNLIRRAPLVWPSFTEDTRKYTLKHFPYKIIYRVTGSQIEVIAVAHDRRRSNYWAKRIGSKH